MADHRILISVVDATGCVLRIYQMHTEGSMKQLITHFTDFACPFCVIRENITFWYEDTQITTLHTPTTLALPPFAKITIKPSILCATSFTEKGHTLPILHHFTPPLVHLQGGTFTTTSIGGTTFPFGPRGLNSLHDCEAGWERREKLRWTILGLKKQEKDLIRKIVVGSVYEKYAVNGASVREGMKMALEDRERVGERCRVMEEELEREVRRDSIWVS